MWQEIADSARTSTTDESRLLAESITRILSEIRAAKEDMADSLIQKALTSGAGNTLLYGIQMASDAWDKTMGNWSVGKAIRTVCSAASPSPIWSQTATTLPTMGKC